jgi:hypothetical protein
MNPFERMKTSSVLDLLNDVGTRLAGVSRQSLSAMARGAVPQSFAVATSISIECTGG